MAKVVLMSNKRKYRDRNEELFMMDAVFREQRETCIIKRVENLSKFLEEDPNYSFLPHIPVFQIDKESTKCRMFFFRSI